MEEKIAELVKITQDNTEQSKRIIAALEAEKSENQKKDETIRWMMGMVRWIVVVALACCIITIVSIVSTSVKESYITNKYFTSDYGYGESNVAGGNLTKAGGDIND